MGKKLTLEEVKEYYLKYDMIFLDEEYKGTKYSHKVLCKKNNHINFIRLDNFKRKHKCPQCTRHNPYTEKEVKEYIESFGYKMLNHYKGIHDELLLQCPNNHIYKTSFNSFKSNNCRCGKCKNIETASKRKYSIEYIREYMKSFGYTLLTDKYINNKQRLEIMCGKGHIFQMSFSKFKNSNHRCPLCKMTNGEQEIEEILKDFNILYNYQYPFDDCKNKECLPFDFYLPQYNCCIEYDGEYHYHYNYFGNTLLDLMNRKYKDNIKTNYCQQNNIKLIRIPYWDFNNIKNILKQQLNL